MTSILHGRFASLTAATLLLALVAAGCSKDGDQSAQTTAQSVASPAVAAGDAARGKQLFASAKCTSCHGANGIEGGVGPSLKGEKARKDYVQTIAQIRDPQPPMPKLYPDPLNDKDVRDIAAYVQTL
ncbi:MAG: c-type cytochrome [Candidatus Eremiobacteraeota bacterium]|nr:c-type cytochrome [Candidatus Eremiobacteraeota bacterium]